MWAQSAGPAAFASLLAAGAAIAAAEGELTRAAELLAMADVLQRASGVPPAARQALLERLQAPIAAGLGAEAAPPRKPASSRSRP